MQDFGEVLLCFDNDLFIAIIIKVVLHTSLAQLIEKFFREHRNLLCFPDISHERLRKQQTTVRVLIHAVNERVRRVKQ